jgi:hypothetical protein
MTVANLCCAWPAEALLAKHPPVVDMDMLLALAPRQGMAPAMTMDG